MLPADLAKQKFAVQILTAHKMRSKFAHTYLFSGGSAASRKHLAEFFAVHINDPEENAFGETHSSLSRRISERNHPDVRWLGEDEKLRSLKIDDVRDIMGWASLKPYEAVWKVFIVIGAERLTVEAQNALLKTLEEPPAKTIFCLLAANKDNLLETIRSRSFEIRLRPEEEGEESGSGLLESFGKKRWEDFFDDFQSSPRDEVVSLLDALMIKFRQLLALEAGKGLSPVKARAWLEAIDEVYSVKTALDENANQKLALTRLAVRIKKLLPNSQLLKADV